MTRSAAGAGLVVCVDVGSTWTKAALVDTAGGRLLLRAQHRTTLPGGGHTDVLEGLDACVAQLTAAHPAARDAEVRACSSAGGGLRIAVVGNEELVTAEAGRRAALSSGGRVVAVVAGGNAASPADRSGPDLAPLMASDPDVVLLVGGTDGGDHEVLLRCARALAGCSWPVVVAGNRAAAPEVTALLAAAGTPCSSTANVLPRIGVLEPEPARRAIRAVFLEHVIGGRELSPGPRFGDLVRGATPDVVLTAVERLADHPVRDRQDRPGVVVVDVGGATTDVYSVVPLAVEPDASGLGRDVVAATRVNRSVEGDLGLRWSARGTVAAAAASGCVGAADLEEVRAGVERLLEEPGWVPRNAADRDLDARLTAWAAAEALRRHALGGVDLRTVGILVGSGGALRHATDPEALLRSVLDEDRSWLLPQQARSAVDTDYVLAAAGLLAEDHPAAADRLLERLC